MGPFRLHQGVLGEFNFVIGGSRFVMLHHLALTPHSSPKIARNCLAPKLIVSFLGGWAKEILVFPGNCPKKVPNMAQVLQNCLARKMI